MERGKRQSISSFFGGTGFYIALALCVVVIGTAGYFLLFDGRNADNTEVGGTADNVVQQVAPAPVQTAPSREQTTPITTPKPATTTSKPATVILPERQPQEEPSSSAAPHSIVAPVQGETVSAFSADALQYSETLGDWRTHDGIDIGAPAGTAVVAACSGTVVSVTEDSRLGTTVILSHSDGYETTYASLDEAVSVSAGDSVSAGQQIGTVSNSSLTESALGAHLHFSVTQDGRPVDPAEYLAQ